MLHKRRPEQGVERHLLLSLTDLRLTVDSAACLCSPVLGLWACSGTRGLVYGCWGSEHKPSWVQYITHPLSLSPALRFLFFPLFHSFLITVVLLAEVSCLDRGVWPFLEKSSQLPLSKMRQLKGKPKKETSKDKKERKQAMQEARQQITTVVLPTLAVVVLLIVVFVYVATRPAVTE